MRTRTVRRHANDHHQESDSAPHDACAASGATLALPLLDSMVPALSALAQTAAKPINRFGVVYVSTA